MSNEKQETIADIAADYRETAAMIRAELSLVPARREDELLAAESLEREADRIEAAARRAYNEINREVCSIEDAASSEIGCVRKAMERTIGDYYE